MKATDKIEFLADKIQHLGTALFHMHSNSLLKLPSNLVQTILVDVNGFVWFAIEKPSQDITEFDQQFYVGLNFYRKGIPYFLKTYGLARLVADPEGLADLPPMLLKENADNKILISVKILNATYYEHEPAETPHTWVDKCRHFIKSLVLHDDNHYILNFEKHPFLSW